jgi:hypothetical protein
MEGSKGNADPWDIEIEQLLRSETYILNRKYNLNENHERGYCIPAHKFEALSRQPTGQG